ncbi:hypothetical protein Tco_1364056 [Tanacetum coccineum]
MLLGSQLKTFKGAFLSSMCWYNLEVKIIFKGSGLLRVNLEDKIIFKEVSIRRFKKHCDEEHITIWNCPNGIRVRFQGRAEVLMIVLLNKNNRLIRVNGRLPWENVLRLIRGSFGLLDAAE